MAKKHRHHSSHHHKHALPFNFVSGLIYAGAVIASITLGALFYRGYQRAHPKAPAADEAQTVFPDLPPGAKVITRSGRLAEEQKKLAALKAKPAPQPQRPSEPKPAITEPPPAEPAPAPAPAAPEQPADQAMPDLKTTPRTQWAAVYVDRTLLQESKLLPTADTTAQAPSPAGIEVNGGAAPELTVDGTRSVILTKVDAAKIKGWTLSKATWNAKIKSGRVRSLGFSSIPADWAEGTGQLKGPPTGATFLWADYRKTPWHPDRVPLSHVIRGNNGSYFGVGVPDKLDPTPDEWVSVEFDPAVVQAIVAGVSRGIAITDEKGQAAEPVTFLSREDPDNSPFITVEGGLIDMAPPGVIPGLRAFAHPHLRTPQGAGVLLAWTAPGDDGGKGQAFAYDIRYANAPAAFDAARPLPRVETPFPQPPGNEDRVIVRDLSPDTEYVFFVRAIDEAGQAGPVAQATVRTPPALTLPRPPEVETFDASSIDVAGGAVQLRVAPEGAGVQPVGGRIADCIGTPRAGDSVRSTSWDRNARTLRFQAAQNEAIGFLLVLDRKGKDLPPLRIEAQPFRIGTNVLEHCDIRFHRVWHTYAPGSGANPWKGDPLIPLDGPLNIASPPNKVPDQTTVSVYGEFTVPDGTPAGLYQAEIAIGRDGGAADKLPVMLKVLPVALPALPGFTIELIAPPSLALLYKKDVMNTAEALPLEKYAARLARDHRCTLVFLPYLRNGSTPAPFVPPSQGKGLDFAVTSWDEWDARFGEYFSGSAFNGTLGGGNPVAHVVLPVFENWPTEFSSGFGCTSEQQFSKAGGGDVFVGSSDKIYSCLSGDYWRAFRAGLQKFREHFSSHSWNETIAHLWLNGGPSSGYAGGSPPWALGAPRYRDDFLALESYAQVAMAEIRSWPGQHLRFRVSVPDAVALAGYGADAFGLLSVSDPDSAGWDLLRRRVQASGEEVWLQSDVVPLDDSSILLEAIVMRQFLRGASGWSIREAMGTPEQMGRGQPSSLIYSGILLNLDLPLASLRLKSIRRAAQDIEYLLLLEKKMEWSRDQTREFVATLVPALTTAGTFSAQDLDRFRAALRALVAP